MTNQPSLPALGVQEKTRQEVSTSLRKLFVLVLGTSALVDGHVEGGATLGRRAFNLGACGRPRGGVLLGLAVFVLA